MWERSIYRFPLAHAPNGDWTRNPGLCPDWELNWWPFTLWDCAQLTGAHQSGLETFKLPQLGVYVGYCYLVLRSGILLKHLTVLATTRKHSAPSTNCEVLREKGSPWSVPRSLCGQHPLGQASFRPFPSSEFLTIYVHLSKKPENLEVYL